MVLQLDLLNEGRPCSKGLSHDGDQHVQEMDQHQEGNEDEQSVQNYFLSCVTLVEIARINIAKDEVVKDEPDSPFPSLIGQIVFNTVKLNLGLADEMEACGETETVEHQDQDEITDVPEDLTDDVHQGSKLIDQRHVEWGFGEEEEDSKDLKISLALNPNFQEALFHFVCHSVR